MAEVSPSFDTKSVSCGSNNRISLPEIADYKNPFRMQQIQTNQGKKKVEIINLQRKYNVHLQ